MLPIRGSTVAHVAEHRRSNEGLREEMVKILKAQGSFRSVDEALFTAADTLRRILCTDKRTDTKQSDNRKFTMTPSGRMIHCSPYSFCTGRYHATATVCHPAQSMTLRSPVEETTVRQSE